MDSLVNRMVQDDPAKRPTMDAAMKELQRTVKQLSQLKLRERLVLRRDGLGMNLLKGVHHFSFRTVPDLLTFRAAIPTVKG